MSPEVLLNAGIQCCRLIQNAGEFVVTFPRAYHSGFSHGFNCAEASNIATPEWLKFARKAAIQRATINFPQLVSHNQLLYNLALSSSSRVPMSVESRSLTLKERKKGDGEYPVKELFVQDVVHNTNLLHILGKESPAILLPLDLIEKNFPKSRDGNTIPLYSKHNDFSCTTISKKQKMFTEEKVPAQCERLADAGIFSCVTCGVLCFPCNAIIRPSEVAAHNLMSADCGNSKGKSVASEVSAEDADDAALASSLGRIASRSCNYLSDVPASCSRRPKDISSLALIALTYGETTESETESREVSCLDSDDDGLGTLFTQYSDENSSRSHVFCLQHAFEVEQKLRALGGGHVLLICHPEYPKFLAEAKLMADDLGAAHHWSNIDFRSATEEDWDSFNSSLNSEGSVDGNADWTVKLGVNLFCSAEPSHFPIDEIGKSTLKRKRMADVEPTSSGKCPEAEVSVKASDHAAKNKCFIVYERRSKLKEKVIQEKSLPPEKDRDQGAKQFDVNMEEKLEEGGPSSRLRPRTGKQPAKDPELVMDKAIGRTATKKLTGTVRAKSTRAIQASSVKKTKKSDETEYACKTEGCALNFGSKQELVLHKKNICSIEGCGKKFASHKYLLQHQKVHLDDRPLKCSWVGCSKTFKWAWARTEHMRVHTGARPYVCGETGCGKTFRFVSDFSHHKRTTGHPGKVQESAKKGKKKTK